MIDYNKPDDDLIVNEVRRAREDLAAEFDYDLVSLCDQLQRRQSTTGRKYAALTPKTPDPEIAKNAKCAG